MAQFNEYQQKLRSMIQAGPDQVAGLDNSISQVNDQLDELQSQDDAMVFGMLNPSAYTIRGILGGKALAYNNPEAFAGEWADNTSYGLNEFVSVSIYAPDSTAGSSITYYECIQAHTSSESTKPESGASWATYWSLYTATTTYSVSLGGNFNVISEGNSITNDWSIKNFLSVIVYQYGGVGWDSDPQIIQLCSDWDFGNDYLTKSLGTGGTYGIRPYGVALNQGKTILTNNRNKINDSITVFEPYASS
jgi:hypothetical protein